MPSAVLVANVVSRGNERERCWVLFLFFLAALGLCCYTRAFSSCSEWGLLFVVVRSLLIAVASLVVEHGL